MTVGKRKFGHLTGEGVITMNIQKLIDKIWKDPSMNDDKIISAIQKLPSNQLALLHGLYQHIKNNTVDSWLCRVDTHHDYTINNFTKASLDERNFFRDIIICFYLSEYRLDDLLSWPGEMRDRQLKDMIRSYGLNKDILLTIYQNWVCIKKMVGHEKSFV